MKYTFRKTIGALLLTLVFTALATSFYYPSAQAAETNTPSITKVQGPKIENTTLKPYNVNGYDYVTTDAAYTFAVKANSAWGDCMLYSVNLSGTVYSLTYQAQDYSYRDKYGSQDYITSIQNVIGTVSGTNITFVNPFPHTNLTYSALSGQLKENFIVSALPKTPASYLTSPITLDFGGYLKFPNLNMYVNDTKMTSSNFVTSSAIQFVTSNLEVVFYLPIPIAVDALGNSIVLQYEVKNNGNQIWFYIRTPYTWLQTATFPVYIDPSIVAVGREGEYNFISRGGLGQSNFYAQNNFWQFYTPQNSSGWRDINYTSSADGLVWSTPITLPTKYIGDDVRDFSLYYKEFKVYLACAIYDNSANIQDLYLNVGTVNANSTITWGTFTPIPDLAFNNPFCSKISIILDQNNYIWIACYESQFHNYIATRSGNNDTTWGSTPAGFPYKIQDLQNSMDAALVLLTDNKIAFLRSWTSANYVTAIVYWNGTAWGNEYTYYAYTATGRFGSIVAVGDDVYFTGFGGGNSIALMKYTYSTNSISTLSSTIYAVAAALTYDPTSGILYFWQIYTDAPIGIHYIKYNISTQQQIGSMQTLYTPEFLDYFEPNNFQVYQNPESGYVGISFVTHYSNTYTLRFADISVTYPTYSYITTSSTISNSSCTFSIAINDLYSLTPNGQYQFGTNNTGAWVWDSPVNFTATPQTVNVIKTFNSTVGAVVGYCFNFTSNTGLSNTTGVQYLTTTGYNITVTSAYGSPTASGSVCYGGSFSTSVTSPVIIDPTHRMVCLGYSIDGGANTVGTTYDFVDISANHTIVYNWQEQYISAGGDCQLDLQTGDNEGNLLAAAKFTINGTIYQTVSGEFLLLGLTSGDVLSGSVSWHGYTVNASFQVSISSNATLTVNCTAYAYSLSGTLYHVVSDRDFNATVWDGTHFAISLNNASSAKTLLFDAPRIPTYITGLPYDVATSWNSSAGLFTVTLPASTVIVTLNFDNWGSGFYIQQIDTAIAGASWSGQALTYTLSSSGTGTFVLKCAIRGLPTSTQGLSGNAYDAGTTTLTALYSNQNNIVLDWTTQPSNPSDPSNPSNPQQTFTLAIQSSDIGTAYLGQNKTATIAFSFSGTTNFQVLSVLFSGAGSEYIKAVNIPQTFYSGAGTITVDIDPPMGAHEGTYSVSVTLTGLDAAGLQRSASGQVTFTLEREKIGLTTGVPDNIAEIIVVVIVLCVVIVAALAVLTRPRK